jgi:hypothetical protein
LATFGQGQRARIEERQGVIVAAGVRFTNHIQVGDFGIFNQSATIAHDVVIGDFVHIAPGSIVSGNVSIGHLCWIGAGAAPKGCIEVKLPELAQALHHALDQTLSPRPLDEDGRAAPRLATFLAVPCPALPSHAWPRPAKPRSLFHLPARPLLTGRRLQLRQPVTTLQLRQQLAGLGGAAQSSVLQGAQAQLAAGAQHIEDQVVGRSDPGTGIDQQQCQIALVDGGSRLACHLRIDTLLLTTQAAGIDQDDTVPDKTMICGKCLI